MIKHIILISVLVSSFGFSQKNKKSLEDKIKSLEERIRYLEDELNIRKPQPLSTYKKNWILVKKTMSQRDVKIILGNPVDIENYESIGRVILRYNEGSVYFEKGKLIAIESAMVEGGFIEF